MFASLIHTRTDIAEIEKFQYLKASLSGDAASVIQTIPLSASNYTIAWKIITKRFENKPQIINNHITAIFEIECIPKESNVLLQSLLNTVMTNISALKSLDQPTDSWDTIIIYLIRSKLDPTTKREWEKVRSEMSELPTLDDLTSFLTKKCQLLEALHLNTKRQVVVDKPERAKSSHLAVPKFECRVCKGDHAIYRCSKFMNMTPNERLAEVSRYNLCKNCLRYNHKTKDCTSSKCRKCDRQHNTLLHIEKAESSHSNLGQRFTVQESTSESTPVNNVTSALAFTDQVFLPTALVYVSDVKGLQHEARVLLDSGSQANFVRRNFITSLGFMPKPTKMTISGINNSTSKSLGTAFIKLHSRVNSYQCKVSCFVLDNITNNVPQSNINVEELKIPNNVQLADPSFARAGKIDVLLGVEKFWSLICAQQISLGRIQPTLQETLFGWVVSGPMSKRLHDSNYSCLFATSDPYREINKQLADLWQLQEIPTTPFMTDTAKECERIFEESTERNSEGRFVVKLPFKENVVELGNSYHIATNRLLYIEKRILSNAEFRQQYSEVIHEYLRLGHATEIQYDRDQLEKACFLPHHAVIRPDKTTTKLRVVFDASCKTDSGISLNDTLMVGPVVQSDLFTILVEFRFHRVAAIGDCEKMYRQILVHPSHRIYQNILWRDSTNSEIKTLQLNTVSFGTASAPYIATRCIQQIALDNATAFPEASKYIHNSFYVDDFIASFESEEKATNIISKVNELLSNYGFSMRKWASNHSHLLDQSVPNESRIHFDSESAFCRTLGLDWDANDDTFHFPVNMKDSFDFKITKRQILSVISSIFDPLGLIGPVIVKSKIILQRLWQINSSWDEAIPMDLHTIWCSYYVEFTKIPKIIIQRQTLCDHPIHIQIHAFSDASEEAYGACVYLRSTDSSGRHTVQLLCSKGRVAPLKIITIPRLELMAAHLLSKLVSKIRSTNLKIDEIFLWCDSSIVLAWLRKHPSQLKTFVAHRVADIISETDVSNWSHVKSCDNPADLLTRGISTDTLISSQLWWQGPTWLTMDRSSWPSTTMKSMPADPPELKSSAIKLTTQIHDNTTDLIHSLIRRFSRLQKLQRVLAYVLRFINNTKKSSTEVGPLSVSELKHALHCIVKQVQSEVFAEELSILNTKEVPTSNRLSALNPFIDGDGCLRVGGRIRHSNLEFTTKHPVILPKSHPFTDLVIWHYHTRNLHAGAYATLNASRQAYWIISGKSAVTKVTSSCVRCRRFNARPPEPIMGDLPGDRVTPSKPFTICGTDFAGPFLVRSSQGRGSKTTKAYLCLFICFATKAVHLEIVSNLSTDAFIACLKRFVSRRGLCNTIYSDNGSNYVGASNQIKEIYDLLSNQPQSDAIAEFLSQLHITWKFIPAQSPNFGGLWESAIKSAKRHLYKMMGNMSFTYEELNTLFCQIESVMNSRPLIAIPTQPNDLAILTPGHFLIGHSLQTVPEPHLLDIKQNRLTRFEMIQQLHQQFWKSWSRDYLNLLQTRSKWRQSDKKNSIKEGSIVLLRDSTPPLLWRLGRIVKLHPGQDDVVRVVTVKQYNNEVKRPITKIVPLITE